MEKHTLTHNYLGSKVTWYVDAFVGSVSGEVKGVYYHPRRGDGAYNWMLQVKLETVRTPDEDHRVGRITEVILANVTFL